MNNTELVTFVESIGMRLSQYFFNGDGSFKNTSNSKMHHGLNILHHN